MQAPHSSVPPSISAINAPAFTLAGRRPYPPRRVAVPAATLSTRVRAAFTVVDTGTIIEAATAVEAGAVVEVAVLVETGLGVDAAVAAPGATGFSAAVGASVVAGEGVAARAVVQMNFAAEKQKRLGGFAKPSLCIWLRGQDLNLRPSGYEPDELPDCSTPRLRKEY